MTRHSSPRSGSTADRPGGEADLSLVQIANVVLRHRGLILGASLAVAFLAVVVSVLLSPSFTSRASFMPQSGQQLNSRVAGLTSQFGFQIPTGEVGQSPQFYADLVRSDELLRSAVRSDYSFRVSDNGDSSQRRGDLMELFEIEGESEPRRVAKAVEVLRERLSVATDDETGVVSLEVTAGWPELAHQIADRILELVNRFNLERRQTQAHAEREFLERRVAEARDELRAAEDSLEIFLENNRQFANSPSLRFQHDRLQRRVDLQQQLYTSLLESYQQARIEEVRNTPVVTVVGRPIVPPRPNSKRLLLKALLGLVFGGLAALLYAFGREIMAATRNREPDHYAEFSRLIRETKGDLRRAWNRVT